LICNLKWFQLLHCILKQRFHMVHPFHGWCVVKGVINLG
jgi:hypothetical protein